MKSHGTTDGRTRESKRFRSIVADIHHLVGDRLPHKVLEKLANEFGSLVVQQDRYTKALLDGDDIDVSEFVKLCNASNRVLRLLGLVPGENGEDHDPTETLEHYIATKQSGNGTKRKVDHKKDRRRERMGKNL